MDDYALPTEFHPAGILEKGLLIEPIAKYQFFYNWCNIKGIADVTLNQETKKWFIEIEDTQIRLSHPPILNYSYILPDFTKVKRYLNSRIYPMSTKSLFKSIENYFRMFMDIEKEGMYKILAIYPFLSFFQDQFQNVFYIM
ncbi:MAG: hypothetical protein IH949_08660, partial [Bacteroidetes bacterium]|nr:hypothetical protein [Bacteroidota bacterium]